MGSAIGANRSFRIAFGLIDDQRNVFLVDQQIEHQKQSAALAVGHAQRLVVRRLQRRVHAGESSLLYPLTITDFASRYLVACEALSTTQERYAFGVFERAFREFGLPQAIRTDNGVPFASAHALYGLSKLSVWWLRLDIQLERIMPGHPEQNGRHERMHLTLKSEATRPAAANVLQQQGRFDAFVHRYNHERPHQALDMKTPRRCIRRRRVRTAAFHDWTAVITTCGRICYQRRKINVSQVFAWTESGGETGGRARGS